MMTFSMNWRKKIDNCKNELADKFEGGKCTISADKNSVNVNAELYSTENEEWSKKNITYSVPVSRFSKDEATRNKIKELRNEPNRFDIT